MILHGTREEEQQVSPETVRWYDSRKSINEEHLISLYPPLTLLLQEEEEKRKIKGSSRLSFAADLENGSDEDDAENKSSGTLNVGCRKLGKDPSVETNFLPDSSCFEAEEQAERERLKQWLREQEQITYEPLQITYSHGTGYRRVIQASTHYIFLLLFELQFVVYA
ncbi:Protein XAP5 CIRCADIAN TIMEKEEPER [Cardamine amara subsp. amara]|uniref:Protein XAP5 CIRCADIAN TIMEKEEPER n=1 Tax=Cardamine amara subsp. amara TaxID=228776 RepID=A0ABD1C9A5_CARAN